MSRCKVALVGSMGVGKSTVGRLVAEILGFTFVDLDREIESRCGMTIREIFAASGEEGFRTEEEQTLRQVTEESVARCTVLATGGGIVTTPSACKVLSSDWDTVWLTATTDTILHHLHSETSTRPMLDDTEDLRARIEGLSTARGPLYESVALWSVSVDNETAYRVARRICQLGRWTTSSE